jgi:hypothetical protein
MSSSGKFIGSACQVVTVDEFRGPRIIGVARCLWG